MRRLARAQELSILAHRQGLNRLVCRQGLGRQERLSPNLEQSRKRLVSEPRSHRLASKTSRQRLASEQSSQRLESEPGRQKLDANDQQVAEVGGTGVKTEPEIADGSRQLSLLPRKQAVLCSLVSWDEGGLLMSLWALAGRTISLPCTQEINLLLQAFFVARNARNDGDAADGRVRDNISGVIRVSLQLLVFQLRPV